MHTLRKTIISPSVMEKFKQEISREKLKTKRLAEGLNKLQKAFSKLYFYKKPYTIPIPQNPEKYLFTENLNYFTEGRQSIWGRGDPETLAYLNSLSLSLSTG